MSLPLASLGGDADALAQEIDRLHGPVTLVRRCADLVELLAVVRSGLALAVLVDDGEEMTAMTVDSLRAAGAVTALLIARPSEHGGLPPGCLQIAATAAAEDAARSLLEAQMQAEPGGPFIAPGDHGAPARPHRGVSPQDAVPPGEEPGSDPGADRDDITDADTGGRPGEEPGAGPLPGGGTRDDRGPYPDREDPGFSAPFELGGLEPEDEPSDEEAPLAPRGALPPVGRVVVVWGPHGSPGRTTVAVNLAAECAQLGAQTSLVDLDTWGPSAATLLGLLDETAGVALACRAADRDRLTPEAFDRAAVEVAVEGGRVTVLTGLTRPERWPELRAGSVQRLLRACQHMPRARAAAEHSRPSTAQLGRPAPVTIVDVGFSLEEDEELSFDAEVPRRSAATTAALREADLVVAVCAADVLGIPRAARAVPTLLEITPAPVMLVANKVRRSAAGSAPRSAVKESWAAVGAPGQMDAFLRWDARTLDAAALDGSALAEAAPGSALRSELTALAGAVLRRLDGDLAPQPGEEVEDVRGTRLGRRSGGWWRR